MSGALFLELHVAMNGDPAHDAANIVDKLFELPVETRRAVYLLVQDNGDTFCNADEKRTTKVHAFPPKRAGR